MATNPSGAARAILNQTPALRPCCSHCSKLLLLLLILTLQTTQPHCFIVDAQGGWGGEEKEQGGFTLEQCGNLLRRRILYN